ncbi:hypothetical protein D9M70_551780 [compost metagenome]
MQRFPFLAALKELLRRVALVHQRGFEVAAIGQGQVTKSNRLQTTHMQRFLGLARGGQFLVALPLGFQRFALGGVHALHAVVATDHLADLVDRGAGEVGGELQAAALIEARLGLKEDHRHFLQHIVVVHQQPQALDPPVTLARDEVDQSFVLLVSLSQISHE